MSATQAQEAFAARMAEKHITPLWTIANRIVMNEPTPKIPPVYWNYQRDVRPYILEAAELITAAEAHRRVLVLNNPTLKHGATHTLTCAIQAIKGGEVAPAHRHSQAGLRLVIEGEGAYPGVNGEGIYWKPGIFMCSRAWTRTALENMRKANDWDVCHALKLKFANPATGDWVMPTIATFAQLLPKGFHTAPYRSTEATVVMAAEGAGKVNVGDQTYTLAKNDIFVVPNWTWWDVEAQDDLVLLSYSDRAALEKLDLWRQQRANEPARP